MYYGSGGGFRPRGGMGFGFHGSSPPWPYVGIGRGGLPRCGYFFSGVAGVPAVWPYPQTPYAYGSAPFAPQMSKEQELAFLKDQAGAIKEQLEQVEARVRELEGGE